MAIRKYISLNTLSSFLDNLKSLFATKTEMDAKSDKNHVHTIADITNLQSTLNGKANSSHGTHVTYSSTAPVMDGTASVGSAATVARSDHRHPTDTSRASQTSLDTHTSNTTSHITSTERTNWGTAYTHSQSAHAPSNAEKNQNAFSNVKVGDVTVTADTTTDTLTLVAGTNVTITPDATNDKITISAKDTTYSLSSFGITATAAEINKLDGVTATATEINYVDGVTSNIQNQLNGKAASSHTHKVANISDLTATATELNYMDGVTSSVQVQLDGKASSGHTHSYAGSSSSGGAATSANKLNTNAGSATQPVYFADGIPKATTYTLGKSVPSNAVFTDTHYASKNVIGATNATSNTASALTNGNVYLNSVENGAVTSSHKISGSGATTVTTDTSGNIIISSTDNNTTYSAAGSALGLVKSGGDVTISSGVITVNDDSHNHTIANVDNLQSSLDAKQNTVTGGASTITTSNLTANRALVSNGSGKVAVSAVTSTELGYLDGVTSNVQTQLDGKAASSHTHSISNVSGLQGALDGKSSTSHTHSYAGSPSVGGGASTLAITDTRNVNDTPTEMTNLIGGKGARLDFKSTSTVGLSNGTYAAVLSISPWGDVTNWSGGKNTQLGFCDDGRIQVRKGNGSGWTNWNTLIDSSTIGNQSVKYATSAGSATSSTKATQDASGNVITNTYATKTELDTAKSNLQTSINGKANSNHTHTIANVTNLQSTLDGKSNTSHTHNYAGSSSAGGSATSAVKLQTARTIGLGTGATGTATSFDGTANITIPVTDVKESYLSWGGKNLSGSISPIAAALSTEHSANRIAYLNPAAITVEYSNDAGSTWTDSGLASSAKTNLVTTSNTVSVGSNSTVTTSHRTRITLTAQNGTTGYVYTRPRKMLINVSTPHGLTVTIEAKTGVSGASWTTLGTYTLSGWSGWNDIPMSISTFGGGANQTSNYWYLRLTFANTSVNSSYTTTKSSIIGLRLFGDTCWTRTSNMGETGHLYSYDSSQNATFPASISGTGTLSMNRKSGTSVGSYSIALGQDCEASGAGSFAEGGFTVASGRYSHAEGYQSKATATYAHAEGVSTTASNMYAHAEGNTTTASGMGCHAEGCETTASGINTHAEGLGTQATSNGDHAEGGYTIASGVFSHAEGYYTKAASSYQHVQGQYNIVDSANTYLHIVGNGESESARSNAHTLDRSGNAWYKGDVYVGGTGQSSGNKLVSLTTSKSTITSFSSGWALYGSNTTPTVRKFGNAVSLTGALKNSSAITLNTNHVQVFTIPSGYRPSQDLVVICQGSGANKYVMQVSTSGAVSIGRYGTTSFSEVASGSWFPFHVSWVIE